MTVQEARGLAQAAALQGRPELAREISAALLRNDPRDRAALIVLAAVEPQLGRPAQGRMAGVRAWRLSETPAQKYEAARLTAFAATREGRPTLAQFWLRRAAIHAPSEAALDQTARDYGVVRRINPWSLRLGFDVAPSSNVNGGSSEEILTVNGEPVTFFGLVGQIPDEAQALSGWTYSGDIRTERRLSASEDQRTSLAFRLTGRGVILSDAAQDKVPEAENGDYASLYSELTLNHLRRADGGTWGVNASTGGSWYGGELSYKHLRIGADRRWQGNDYIWTLAGTDEQRWDDEGARERRISQLSLSRLQPVPIGTLSYTLGAENVTSPVENQRSEALRLSAGFALSEPVGPAAITLGGGFEARRYPEYSALTPVPGGREDFKGWATLSATFTDYAYAGFAPVVTFQASRTDSNVSNFEAETFSLGFSLRSTF